MAIFLSVPNSTKNTKTNKQTNKNKQTKKKPKKDKPTTITTAKPHNF